MDGCTQRISGSRASGTKRLRCSLWINCITRRDLSKRLVNLRRDFLQKGIFGVSCHGRFHKRAGKGDGCRRTMPLLERHCCWWSALHTTCYMPLLGRDCRI